jgi:glycosyltransferase involved in cell wall biosynthesis
MCTLRTFRLIQDRRPDATLTVVGSGKDEHQLRALAGTLRLNHVAFAGRVAPSAINRVYSDHDIYLQSPDIDNMPLSLLEAFSSGLPVVSTDVGGIPAMLRHGEHGLLAPANDHATLAAHVLRLLDEPNLGWMLARNARETVEAYRWPVVREEWLRAYREACVSKGSLRAATAGSAERSSRVL